MSDVVSKRPLFRSEVVAPQRARLYGEVFIAQPVSLRLLTSAVSLAVVLLGVFIATGTYARREHVRGYLLPEHGLVKVYPPRPGVLGAVAVRDGQVVAAGDLLLTINFEQHVDEGLGVEARVLESLEAQRAELLARIARSAEQAKAERAGIEAQISGLKKESGALGRLKRLQRERAGIARGRAEKLRGLAHNDMISDSDVERERDEYLAQSQRHAEVSQQLAEARSARSLLEIELAQLPMRTADRESDLRSSLSEIEQRIAELKGRSVVALRAPAAGRISTLVVDAGQRVDPSIPLMTIVPPEGRLRARLFVPTRAAGFVRAGDRVSLLYDAFPHQRFGTYGASITSVASTVLTPGEIPAPLALEESAYCVEADLDAQDVVAGEARYALKADMLLDAYIIQDRRTLLTWLIEPLRNLQGRL